MKTRLEHDSLGEIQVPADAYYGAQTLRAMVNFKDITGITISDHPYYVKALAMVKWAAAHANVSLGTLDAEIGGAIKKACEEIIEGALVDQFPVDLIQGGAGTSTNMNINEVVANRALEIMGHQKGEYQYCHPNDHVNLSQSTNDAYPTSFKLCFILHNEDLVRELKRLIDSFRTKGKEFDKVIKMGRTQLQDAVPMTLGQEFEAFAATLDEEVSRLNEMASLFLEVNMGATAIGTGINTEPGYAQACVNALRAISGKPFVLAGNLVEATPDAGSTVMYSSALKRLAVKLSKICNDLRLLSSGPRCGLGEITIPENEPGSSIMPGKVNPTQCEAMTMVCTQVMANDQAISISASQGNFELNVFMPVLIHNFLQSVRLLSDACISFNENCASGITANKEKMHQNLHNSLMLVTALTPYIGYENGAKIAKLAHKDGISLKEACLRLGLLTEAEFDKYFRPEDMI